MFTVESLEGNHVRLERLADSHRAGLAAAIADGRLWELPLTLVPEPEQLDGFYLRAEEEYGRGEGLAFVTIDKTSHKVAGSTRFLNANPRHRRVEIGYTFLGASWQRTAVNTEAKFLMLEYAFEILQVNRVDFLTDCLNRRSRNALLRLGAKEEGTLRNHMVMPDGRVRDSVVYSIIANEWPGIRKHLEYKLSFAPGSSLLTKSLEPGD